LTALAKVVKCPAAIIVSMMFFVGVVLAFRLPVPAGKLFD
jgi:hypothetical protein